MKGHYILVYAYEPSSDMFFYRNPAAEPSTQVIWEKNSANTL